MKAILAILAILSVVAAYAAGHYSHATQEIDLAALEEFRMTLHERDALTRSYRFNGFLRTLNERNLPAAVEAIDSQANWLSPDELQNFMLAWAAFDGRGALDWAISQSGRARIRSTNAAIYGWAFYDPDAARKALDALEPADSVLGYTEQLGSGWINGLRSEGSADYVASLPAGTQRKALTNVLVNERLRQGPEAAFEWFESIPDDARDDFKRMAFLNVATAVSDVDPVRAATWFGTHLDRNFGSRGLKLVAARWLGQDGPAAMTWLTDLPPTAIRNDAARSVLRKWLHEDREEAEAWLLAGTPVLEMDPVVRIAVRYFSETDFESAMNWAQRIYASGTRSVVLIGVGSEWFHADREAALEWMSENDIHEEIRLEIVNSRPPPPVVRSNKAARKGEPKAGSPRGARRAGKRRGR